MCNQDEREKQGEDAVASLLSNIKQTNKQTNKQYLIFFLVSQSRSKFFVFPATAKCYNYTYFSYLLGPSYSSCYGPLRF